MEEPGVRNPNIEGKAADLKNDAPALASASPAKARSFPEFKGGTLIEETWTKKMDPGFDASDLFKNPNIEWEKTVEFSSKRQKCVSITMKTTQVDDYLLGLLGLLSKSAEKAKAVEMEMEKDDEDGEMAVDNNDDFVNLPRPPFIGESAWLDDPPPIDFEEFELLKAAYPLPNLEATPKEFYTIDSGKVMYEDPESESEEMIAEDKVMRRALQNAYDLPSGNYLERAASYTSATALFKVGRLPEDDSFLQKLVDAQLPWRINQDVETVANHAVALIIERYAYPRPIWKTLLELSRADKDDGLYTSIIEGVASFVCLLFSQGFLLEIGYRHRLEKQIGELWQDFAVQRRKAIPVDEFCKSIVLHIRHNPKYNFVTEVDLAEMCIFYSWNYENGHLEHSGAATFEVSDPFSDDKGEIFNDIIKVLGEMKSPPTILKADDYARLLMRLLRELAVFEEELLLDNAMSMVDTKALEQHNMTFDLQFTVLDDMLNTVKLWMKQQLMEVVMPLFKTYISDTHFTSNEIIEIVQVAEIRRMALGSRFIGRSHLMWAFYECGYGLPPKIRDTIQVHPDEDHPPYHFYMVATKLAQALGEKTTHLEHFVFAVLRTKDIVCDGEAMGILVQHFKDFHEDLLSTMRTEAEVVALVPTRTEVDSTSKSTKTEAEVVALVPTRAEVDSTSKSTKTEVDPTSKTYCRSDLLDGLSDDSHDSESSVNSNCFLFDTGERITNIEPKSSMNMHFNWGDAQESTN